jgi:hypothetical protein
MAGSLCVDTTVVWVLGICSREEKSVPGWGPRGLRGGYAGVAASRRVARLLVPGVGSSGEQPFSAGGGRPCPLARAESDRPTDRPTARRAQRCAAAQRRQAYGRRGGRSPTANVRAASQLGARANVGGRTRRAAFLRLPDARRLRAAHGLRAARTRRAADQTRGSRAGVPATGRTGARLWVDIGTRPASLVALPMALARDLRFGATIPLHYPNPRGKVWSR